jgi:hypothetical protein
MARGGGVLYCGLLAAMPYELCEALEVIAEADPELSMTWANVPCPSIRPSASSGIGRGWKRTQARNSRTKMYDSNLEELGQPLTCQMTCIER